MAKLQVALDFLNLSRALGVARLAAAAGEVILEAGTPLIKSEGLNAVRALRKEFPRSRIVADMKTMDAGRVEMESAAKAGASAAIVMGLAAPETIRECIEAGRNYGIEVGVDLLGASDAVELARKAQAWGAAFVGIHTPVDAQMTGAKNPFKELEAVRGAVEIPIAVAGGINSETAALAVRSGADVIVVGGAITKAEDVTAATRTILEVISSGVARPTTLFKRMGIEEIRQILSRVSAANLSDALHRGGVIRGLAPVTPGLRLVGRAVTVRTYPGDWAKPVEAIDVAEAQDVIVIDSGGVGPAVWGELATESAVRKKLSGVVVEGAIRDTNEIRKLSFPAFSRLVEPGAGEPKGFGEINVPVRIGGQVVSPGDWMFGDDDGLIHIPKEKIVEVANRGMDVLEQENRIREEIRVGGTLSKVMELLRWEKK